MHPGSLPSIHMLYGWWAACIQVVHHFICVFSHEHAITCYLKRMENELNKISFLKIEVSAFSSKPNLAIIFGIYMMITCILNGIKC